MTQRQLNKLADSMRLTSAKNKTLGLQYMGYGNKTRIYCNRYVENSFPGTVSNDLWTIMYNNTWTIADNNGDILRTKRRPSNYHYLCYNKPLKTFIFYDINESEEVDQGKEVTFHKYRIINDEFTKIESFDLDMVGTCYFLGQSNKCLYIYLAKLEKGDGSTRESSELRTVIEIDIENHTYKIIQEYTRYLSQSRGKRPIAVNDGKIYFTDDENRLLIIEYIASGKSIASHSYDEMRVDYTMYPYFSLENGYRESSGSRLRLYFFDRFTVATYLHSRSAELGVDFRYITFDKDCRKIISNEYHDWHNRVHAR